MLLCVGGDIPLNSRNFIKEERAEQEGAERKKNTKERGGKREEGAPLSSSQCPLGASAVEVRVK